MANTTTNTDGAIQAAATTDKENTALAKAKEQSLKNYVNKMMSSGEIEKALPRVMTPERFTRIVCSALSANPDLMKCTPQSFLGAMMSAAQLGLEPNTTLGQAYLIPYKNYKKGVTECTFQMGYKGLIDLAYRSGEVSIIAAHEVYKNDTFEYELGLEPKLKHIPAMQNRGEVIAYYGVFKTTSGGYGFEIMSKEDVEAHRRKFSKANNSPWDTNFDEMAKKTVIKKALKYAPLKSDFVRAINADETIKNNIADDMLDVEPEYIDTDFEEKEE